VGGVHFQKPISLFADGALSLGPESTCSDGGAFRILQDLPIGIVKYCSCEDLCTTVSNSSNPLEQLQVRVGTRTDSLQCIPHKNLDYCNWVSFTTKYPAFQVHNVGSN